MYRCVATTAEGFVQQLAVSYIVHGYWFYALGSVPGHKDPEAVDQKLIAAYGIDISKWARARRKRAGLANVHYLRFERTFVLIATKGEHKFFEEERYRDVRRDSIHFAGYSIGYKRDGGGKWHASVRIHPDTYRELKAYFLEMASRRKPAELIRELSAIPYARFAPVRAQLLCIVRAVNEMRELAGLEPVQRFDLSLSRTPTTVFF